MHNAYLRRNDLQLQYFRYCEPMTASATENDVPVPIKMNVHTISFSEISGPYFLAVHQPIMFFYFAINFIQMLISFNYVFN